MKHLFNHSRMLLVIAMVFVLGGSLQAQKMQASGSVTDAETKEALIGVTVLEKGTQNGTTCDLNGTFKLSVAKGSTLVFSYIGYESKEMPAAENMKVQLSSKQNMLNQVVVVGYGTQNKKDVTGSIAKVKGSEITAMPVPSFEAGLQGRAAGVTVIQSSGLAGAGSGIKIRGVSSITSGGEPLYVIDGVIIPQNQGERIGAVNTNILNSINPEDIESVDILKDASATAIYGARGTNGVILITTKKARLSDATGVKAKPNFNFGYRTTMSSPTQLYDLLDTEEYTKLYIEAFENDKRFGVANGAATVTGNPNIPLLYGGYDPRDIADGGYQTTDWQKEMVRVGVGHAFDASMTYGGKKLATFVSLGYSNDESYLKNNSFNRFSGRLNLDYTFNKMITAGFNASYAHSVNNLVPVSWNGGLGKAMSTALPYWPIYDQTNTDQYYIFPQAWNGSYNPVQELGNRIMRERFNRTITNAYVKFNFTKRLNLQVDGAVDRYNRQYDEFFNSTLELNPRGSQSSYTPMSFQTKAILNYDFELGKNHSLKIMGGEEIVSQTVISNTSESVTFPKGTEGAPFFENPTIADSVLNSPDYSYKENETGLQYGFVSVFARASYAYKERYLINATLRRDASSRFGENNKWGSFPAIGLGWILTEERFLNDSKWLNFLKLKVAYGKSGNAEIDNVAQYSRIITNDTKKYNGQPIYYITQFDNPDLRWETTTSFDAGFEFGILNDRFSGSFDFYYKKTKDLYLNASVPASSSRDNVLMNVGELWNRGIEFSINANTIRTKNFSWVTSFNLALNENEVTNTGGAGPDAFASTGDVRVLVGYPVGVNYLVKELGVDPATGQPIYEGIEKDEQGNIIRRFETFTYSTDYRQPLGKPWPDWIGGFSNTFKYKQLDAGIMFNFQIGGNIYDDSEKYQLNAIGNWNLRKDVLDRWQNPGDETDIPRMTLNADVPNRNTSRYLHDASYLRLKNLSVGYTLPNGTFKGVKKVRLALNATNLLTWTKYPGMDPEIFRDMENKQERNLSANVTYITPPQARTFSLSVNVEL